jgi:hypothetical protein
MVSIAVVAHPEMYRVNSSGAPELGACGSGANWLKVNSSIALGDGRRENAALILRSPQYAHK